MKTQLESITISGTVIGNIWMPDTECAKEFNVQFTPDNRPFSEQWNGLRDAVLKITNDGDFRSCDILEADIKTVYRISGNTFKTIYNPLPYCKLTSDCMVNPD